MMKGNRGANVSNVAISLSESEHVANFQKKVTTWYLGNHRDLPWRKKDTSPYGIWVSEVMSQQTRIHTVIPYWIKWMKRFPTVQDLAKASIQDVHESWTGLGYYRRATALHEGAKYLVQVYNGAVPNAVEELIKVPGIGPYTAAAIASMAFEQPNAAVDGNVLRVYSRIMGLKDCDLSTRSVQKSIQEKAQQCMDTSKASIWNQAIMELGATICTSQTQPLCSQCPAQLYCAAYELCARGAIPAISGVIPKVSKKKIEKREEKTTALVIICNDHTVLMERRPPGGLLEHLWCFPMRNEFIKQESSMTAFIKQYVPDYSSTARKWKEKAFFCGTLVHIFSHIRLEVAVHMVNISEIPTIKTSKEMNEIQIDDELDSKQRKRKRGVSSRVRQNSAKDDSPSNSSGSVNSIQWVAITEVANQATSTLAKKILTQARSSLKVRR